MNSLELAIQLEMDSKKFYLGHAEKTEDRGLKSIFIALAEEESIHARILKNKADNLSYELVDTYAKIKNLFAKFDDYKSEIKQMPDSLDVYNLSLENEKKTKELYEQMLQEATDEREIKIFKYLIEQEEDHCRVIEQLIEMVRRPEEWVESTEFGLRKEY
ncbi:MAG TPA: ferritin family protein [Acholeplasmataceae bacterium]|nr:ferritin family protein [Acholeplasmataceae bacterium]